MEFIGEFTVDVTPEAVWTVITDPNELTIGVPGARDIERVNDHPYDGMISNSVAGYQLKLDGQLEVIEKEPSDQMAVEVTAGDNSAGSWSTVTGTAEMDLRSSDVEMAIRYPIRADVKGRLASLGSTLVTFDEIGYRGLLRQHWRTSSSAIASRTDW